MIHKEEGCMKKKKNIIKKIQTFVKKKKMDRETILNTKKLKKIKAFMKKK